MNIEKLNKHYYYFLKMRPPRTRHVLGGDLHWGKPVGGGSSMDEHMLKKNNVGKINDISS